MEIAEMTVEEVARRWPGALGAFSSHGIDICCGGDKTVRDAAALHNVALSALLRELASVGATGEQASIGRRDK